jgi:hypothetical protein
MKVRKGVRILLWTAGSVVAGMALLYLLRWPIAGRFVRSKAGELALRHLQVDLEFGELGGSLFTGLEARRVTLRPRVGSPLRSAEIRDLSVDYGFLASGDPSIRVDGARIVLATKEGPAPPVHESIRDVVSVLRSLRFPGAVSARNIDLVLPDEQALRIDSAQFDQREWNTTVLLKEFGAIQGKLIPGAEGAFTFSASASDGPLSAARIDMGAGADRCSLRIAAELREPPALRSHPLTWEGTAFFDKGRIARVDGELTVKEGRAKTRVDLVAGRVEADVDAVVSVDQELKGDVAITAHAEGPLAGPKEAWSVREGRIKTGKAKIRTIPIDEADVAFGVGSLAQISFKGSVRSGEDKVGGEGIFRWSGKDPEIEANVDATAADAAPYLALLAEPPRLKCRRIQAGGKFLLKERAASYDGRISTGDGEIGQIGWKSLVFAGSLGPDRVEARELVLNGTAYAPKIVASGNLQGENLSLKFSADRDQGEIGGRYRKNGEFEGRLRLEGPMTWLDSAFQIRLPEKILPLRAEGKVFREKDDTAAMLEITGSAGFAMSLHAKVRRQEQDWFVAVAPGTVKLPDRSIRYDAFVFALTKGRASLENLKVDCTEPRISARISGSGEWDDQVTKLSFSMLDTQAGDTPIDNLVARVAIDRPTGVKDLNLRWGKEDGDHLLVRGKWGKELDLHLELRAGDLKRPLVKEVLRVDLEGSISLDAHVTGTPEEPQSIGTLTLSKVSTAGLPALSLVVPIKSSKEGLRLWAVSDHTPYGSLTIEGTIPLRSDAPLDLNLKILTDDFSPLLERMTRQARAWIPRGGLAAEVWLRGPASKPELGGRAEFVALRWKPPPPLGEATDLRVVAKLDHDGISFETVDGLLGQGPFWARGRWDAFLDQSRLSLWVTAWDALVVDDPLARIRVKPDVALTWVKGSAVRLVGRVEIPLAIYHREFTVSAPGARVVRQVSAPRLRLISGETGGFLIPGIEGLEGLEIDLEFATTGECRIENSVVGVMFRGEGQLTGTGAEPALSGVFRSREHRGEVKLAPGNFLRIESMEITFPEDVGRNPAVRFQGRVGGGEGAIEVFVEGPLENPSLVLKSDPPQPQKDLLAKLAFGQGSGAVSKEAGVAAVAIYIYGQAKEDWPSADRKEGFFDKFRPTVVPGETTLQRRVPWELPPAGTMRSTSLRTEYVYNSYFSVIAETNREGDMAGDLKLRIRF